MARTKVSMGKVEWSGRIVAVQPRIRLMRSFDERQHSYQGYVLRVDGTCGDEGCEFQIAIGKAAHKKHQFRVGMEARFRSQIQGTVESSGVRIAYNQIREVGEI